MSSDTAPTVKEILSDNGALSTLVENFQSRAEQITMATAVAAAITAGDTLCVEAGTGTGKTFAYLLPALLSGKKVIISTGTKNLQDQLFHKDLPMMIKAVGTFPKVALLKGRANYVCLYRLDMAYETGRFNDKANIKDLQTVTKWSHSTTLGDIAEVDDVAEDAPIWPWVTSNESNCLGTECPLFNKCYVVKARRKAQAADVVIINHHLFFADLSLQEQSMGELLPQPDVMIFDEAHQLPEIATHFFDTQLSSRQIMHLAEDIDTESLKVAFDVQTSLHQMTLKLRQAIQDVRLSFGVETRRDVWSTVKADVQRACEQLKSQLTACVDILESASDLSEGLNHCWERALAQMVLFNRLTEDQEDDHIHWFETYQKSVVLHVTPMSVAKSFDAYLQNSPSTKIFTSATLTIGEDFSYFQEQLNLQSATSLCVASPFNYRSQALLYAPRYLPPPNSEYYTERVLKAVLPLILAMRGRTFLLFTSHRALQLAKSFLQDKVDYPLFVQGDQSKTLLLASFKSANNAILLGTSSFWEGVDIRGNALSCVIIDKLPFASPFDPIMQARIRRLHSQGVNAFSDYQLPKAVLSLKQGVGRLIRDTQDKGLLIVCDPRLVSKSYGESFINSLPPIPRTRELALAVAFAEAL